MSCEYKILEPTDYGHPGAGARFEEFVKELNEHAKEGWEIVQLVPDMMRGRMTATGGKDETITLTTIGLCAVLRRRTE